MAETLVLSRLRDGMNYWRALKMRWLHCLHCATYLEWPKVGVKQCPVCESTQTELLEVFE
jgi:formate dehydrogenase maturation protein FdhE